MSGNVIINGCIFAFNSNFGNHGAAVHYISKIKHFSKFRLKICNCRFTHNGGVRGKSIVYISPSTNKSMEQIYFTNTEFFHNQGVPIYISHQMVLLVEMFCSREI